jgi:hypothetical protein
MGRKPQKRNHKPIPRKIQFSNISDAQLLVEAEELMYRLLKIARECNRRGLQGVYQGGIQLATSKHKFDILATQDKPNEFN